MGGIRIVGVIGSRRGGVGANGNGSGGDGDGSGGESEDGGNGSSRVSSSEVVSRKKVTSLTVWLLLTVPMGAQSIKWW